MGKLLKFPGVELTPEPPLDIHQVAELLEQSYEVESIACLRLVNVFPIYAVMNAREYMARNERLRRLGIDTDNLW